MEILNNNTIKGKPLQGGMGQVFHLFNNFWKIDLAMKQPLEKYMASDEQKDMFIQECEKWMSLGVHPNIVQCYYVGFVDNKMSAFMEWIPGGTLNDVINSGVIYKGNNRNRLLLILEISLQMAIGLRYSHSKGVLHLDMKPSNVLVGENWNVKISDFGISNYLNQSNKKVMYTPLYCAPEQRNNGQLTKATDIYCYGVTLLHLICGEAVWHDGITAGIVHRSILKQFSKIEIPNELLIVLDKCLKINVEERFSSFDEVIELLGKCWDQLNIGSIYKYYPEFFDNVSNSTNNLAVSYYNLHYEKKAHNKWVVGNHRFPYHPAISYNLNLYNYKYGDQKLFYAFTLNAHSGYQDIDYHKFLFSRFLVSTKAYEKAKTVASKAVKKTLITRPEYLDLYLENEKYINQRYNENGPKVIFEMNFKNILKVDSIEKDCAYLGMMNKNQIVYVSKTGRLTLLDLNNKIYRHGNLGLSNIHKSTMTQNGRYLALCKINPSLTKENKIYHEINVYDLNDSIIKTKLSIKGYYESCEFLFFMNQSSEIPNLLMKTKNHCFDWNIPLESKEIENNSLDSNQYSFESNQSLLNLQEIFGDFILGISSNKYSIYDTSNTVLFDMLNFENIYPLSIKTCPNQPYVFMINKDKGLSIFDTVELKYITNESFDQKIHQIAISPDGNSFCILNDTQLQIRNLPNYSIDEKTLWEISPFQTTKRVMDDLNYAKKQEKLIYELLFDDLNEENLKKINKGLFVVRRHLEYDRYLKLCGLLAYKQGFNKLSSRLSFTNENVEYYPMDKQGNFIGFDELRIVDCGSKVQLVNTNHKVLITINCKFEDILGISSEYCYIVCKVTNVQNLKYRLYELEWQN